MSFAFVMLSPLAVTLTYSVLIIANCSKISGTLALLSNSGINAIRVTFLSGLCELIAGFLCY